MLAALVLSFGLLLSLPARADCTVTGTHATIDAIRVHASGAPAFEVSIRETAVRATLVRKDAPIHVEVSGALTFEGDARRVELHLTRNLTSEDGQLRMVAGAEFVDAYFDGSAIVGSLVMSYPFCGGPRIEHVEKVRVPCDAVTLDYGDIGREYTDDSVPNWQVRFGQTRVKVHAAPSAASPAHTLVVTRAFFDEELRLGVTRFEQHGRQGSWLHVRRQGRGTTLEGWVHTSSVDRLPPPETFGYSDAQCGYHGRGHRPQTTTRITATIPANTRIHQAPSGPPWATTTQELTLVLEPDNKAEWAHIPTLPNITTSHAWLPSAALHNPRPLAPPNQ